MAKKLTDVQIRTAKPKRKQYKLSGGNGLVLVVMPSGAKYFRFRYRYAGLEKSISLGVYPATPLKEAEQRAQDARNLLRQDINPSEHRRAHKLAQRVSAANTFGHASAEWVKHNSPKWSAATKEKAQQYLDKDMLPPLAKRPLANITAPELGQVVARIEARKAMNVAKKVRQWLHAIFSFAISKGWVTQNPAQYLTSIAAHAPEAQNHPHLSMDELPAFLKALDGYHGSQLTRDCAWLALWTANRPGITQTVKWSELDLETATWTIPKGREGMKKGYRHITPLPTQAVDMLRRLYPLTGTYEHVFVGRNDSRKPLSDGAVSGMLKTLGYSGKQTMHGFRHLISTALNEKDYDADWIERQLAHGDPDEIRGTYNKAAYVNQRRKMMQEWADQLDDLRTKNP